MHSSFEELCIACKHGDVQKARQLLASVDDVNQLSICDDLTPLIHACRANNVELVQLLLDSGANVVLHDSRHGVTALHWAAGVPSDNRSLLQLLIEHGAMFMQ